MKNRKSIIAVFLIVAAMLFSVGYAALTDTLDLNGTADVNLSGAQSNFDAEVYFASAVANEEGNAASLATGDNDMASFTANTLAKKGEKATFTFTIANDSPHDVLVTPTLASDGNSNTEYFDVYSDWEGQPKTIPAGTTLAYTVTVELKKDPTDATHGAFHIELNVTTVDPAVGG